MNLDRVSGSQVKSRGFMSRDHDVTIAWIYQLGSRQSVSSISPNYLTTK